MSRLCPGVRHNQLVGLVVTLKTTTTMTPMVRLTARRCAATVIRPRHNGLWRNSALVVGASFATSSRQRRPYYEFVKRADRFENLLLSTNEAEMLGDEEIGTILALNRSQFDALVEALNSQSADADAAGAAASLLRAYVSTNKFKPGNLLPLPGLHDAEIPFQRDGFATIFRVMRQR